MNELDDLHVRQSESEPLAIEDLDHDLKKENTSTTITTLPPQQPVFIGYRPNNIPPTIVKSLMIRSQLNVTPE